MRLRQRLVRLFPWLHRYRVDRDVSRELEHHLELETRQNLEQGMAPADAARLPAPVGLGLHGRKLQSMLRSRMAINIAHRPDLDERVERLAARLDMRGHGRKTAVIERALGVLEEQVEKARPDRAYIEASLERLAQAGDRCRERERMRGRRTDHERPLSQVWQEELYDDHGLPR